MIKRQKVFFNCLLILAVMSKFVSGQNEIAKYDKFSDTLLIVNGEIISSDKIYMNRMDFVNSDTFRINQKGIIVASYSMTSFAIGKSIELESEMAVLTKAMKDAILNKQANYKFVSIKNINLQTKDGRLVHPSMSNLRIIFEN